MIKLRLSRKGQNMAEYAIIFGIVIAAAVGVSALIREGIQDRVISEVRTIGYVAPGGNVGAAVFDLSATTNRTSNATENITIAEGGEVTENKTSNGITNVSETYSAGQ